MSATEGPIRDRHLEPHPIANDLTDHRELVPSASQAPSANDAEDRTILTTTERRIGQWLLMLTAIVVIAGLVIAAILARSWSLIGVAAIVFVPYMLYLLAPIWLAESTRIAQDEQVTGTSTASQGESP